jgi:uroporphyrin-III C-methyltransferase/precorrin-2 dehydrogenase/sirohydrochlorin ferrochelatase
MFPVMLQMAEQSCLVVGGGGVAYRKIQGLLAENAQVTVVAPDVLPGVAALADDGRIVLERRPYAAGEGAEYVLVFAATDDRGVNRRVFEDASGAGVWVNVADDPELCTFHLPAVIRRGALHLALASGGTAPFAIRRLRQLMERWIGPEWGEWLDAAARFRERVRGLGVSSVCRETLFDGYFENSVDPETRHVRVPTDREELELLEQLGDGGPDCSGEKPAIGDRVEAAGPGMVSLVGAGPGHPGLLTLLGYRRLMAADAVVYDRLAAPALPCDLPQGVELRCVGKSAGRHPVPQEEISALLIRLSRQGKRVVRLKGGDPFVFGRGGEEAEALAAAGLPFEVVPGVTSGIAGPAWAGIPVTHRREAVRVTFLTAHECEKAKAQVRWDLLAQDPSSTLVAYMGMKALPGMVKNLLDAGMAPETPAAVVERATTSAQRSVISTLSELPEAARRAAVGPPALIVVGPTVAHAKRLDWAARRPLVGRRILVKRGSSWVEPLDCAGAEVVAVTLPLTPAAHVVLEALPLTDVVVASREEVEALDAVRGGIGWASDVTVWCVDRDSWNRAQDLGWNHVEQAESEGGAHGLVEQLAMSTVRTA